MRIAAAAPATDPGRCHRHAPRRLAAARFALIIAALLVPVAEALPDLAAWSFSHGPECAATFVVRPVCPFSRSLAPAILPLFIAPCAPESR
jgi:hypothetical protein